MSSHLTPLTPPKKLLKLTGRAIYDYQMIKQGDKVLLGVSGGKDSLSLFHTLKHFQKHAPINFELGVVSIDPQTDDFDLTPLLGYFKSQNTPYFLEQFPIVEQAKISMKGDSFCAFCSRMKRGLMYKVAREQGYNVLALGQHLDDLAQSLMMSIFHNGKLQTMKAHYTNDSGDVRVIRPFVYVRERQLAHFALDANLPVIKDNCPACFMKPTEREYFKQWLNSEEGRISNMSGNILNAMKPLMANDKHGEV